MEQENKCQWCGSTNYDCINESGKCSNCDDMEEKLNKRMSLLELYETLTESYIKLYGGDITLNELKVKQEEFRKKLEGNK